MVILAYFWHVLVFIEGQLVHCVIVQSRHFATDLVIVRGDLSTSAGHCLQMKTKRCTRNQSLTTEVWLYKWMEVAMVALTGVDRSSSEVDLNRDTSNKPANSTDCRTGFTAEV